jgi:hypothetical protein
LTILVYAILEKRTEIMKILSTTSLLRKLPLTINLMQERTLSHIELKEEGDGAIRTSRQALLHGPCSLLLDGMDLRVQTHAHPGCFIGGSLF